MKFFVSGFRIVHFCIKQEEILPHVLISTVDALSYYEKHWSCDETEI